MRSSYFETSPPPHGFYRAIQMLASCDENTCWNLLNECLNSLKSKSRDISLAHYAEHTSTTVAQVESMVNAGGYIFRGALRDGDQHFMTNLRAHLSLPTNVLNAIEAVWQASTAAASRAGGDDNDGLRGGRLLNFDWKLGVGVSSNGCTALKAPFVGLTLHTIDSDGTKRSRYLELSIDAFIEFQNSFKAVAKQLEVV